MDKRVFTTVLACMGILFVWQTFIAPPPKKKPKPSAAVVKAEPASQAAGTMALAASQPAGGTLTQAPVAAPETFAKFDGPLFHAEFSSKGGAISKMALAQYREADPSKPKEKRPVELVKGAPSVSLLLDGKLVELGEWKQQGELLSAKGANDGLDVSVQWNLLKDGYTHVLGGTINNTGDAPRTVHVGLEVRGTYDEKLIKDRSFYDPPPDLATPLAQIKGSVSRHSKEKKDSPESGEVDWVGVDRQYFLVAAAPKRLASHKVTFVESTTNSITAVASTLEHDEQVLQPGQNLELEYFVFAGPKSASALGGSKMGFENALDYSLWGLPLGFLARPMQWVLNQAYGLTASWGLAIILLTLVVKLIMFPVTQKSYESMQQMRDLKPELDKIKERFPNDREKQGIETMKLYRERKVSPFLSGCLPALLQFPVWVALWRMLSSAVELYQREFLWLPDLTAKDPYYILPAAVGLFGYLQQKVSPPMADPEQQKIMQFMPLIMVVFMVGFPSGLVFYSVINTVLTIAQQLYISKKFHRPAIAVGKA